VKRSLKVEIALKAEVVNYLEMMFDESTWPKTDPVACVDTIWNDRWLGLQDLIVARDEIDVAAKAGARFGINSDEEPKRPTRVMRLLAEPRAMQAIIDRGVFELRSDHWDRLFDWFENSTGDTRAAITFAIASRKLKSTDSRAGRLLIQTLTNDADDAALRAMHYAMQSLGQAKSISEDAVKAVAKVAADRRQSQPIRSIAIESLMDMGPAAKSATELLQDIKKNDDDEDLRMFAWAALKSVTAPSREHPEGGTVADHMRQLYTAE
jgi:Holliday junction resolvasome RuvABC DNA-binding subunit